MESVFNCTEALRLEREPVDLREENSLAQLVTADDLETRDFREVIWNAPVTAPSDAAFSLKPHDFDFKSVAGEITKEVEYVGACTVVFRKGIVTGRDKEAGRASGQGSKRL